MATESNKNGQNRTMPSCTIIPVLGCESVPKSIDWLCKAFQFTERWRAGEHRAQVSFAGGTVALTEQEEPTKNVQSLLVRVTDIEQHYRTAKQNGAKIIQAPTDFPYGEKQYTAIDLNGHEWTFSQSVKDMKPEDWGGVTNKL